MFMEPTWGPSGADRTQVGPTLAPWTLLSGSAQLVLKCFQHLNEWTVPFARRNYVQSEVAASTRITGALLPTEWTFQIDSLLKVGAGLFGANAMIFHAIWEDIAFIGIATECLQVWNIADKKQFANMIKRLQINKEVAFLKFYSCLC